MNFAAMSKTQLCARHGGTFETSTHCGFSEVSIAPSTSPLLAKPTVSRAGTARAINNVTLGTAAFLPQQANRGGARNRADRESHALTTAQISHLMAAERHAAQIGLTFTRMITIHWEAAGVPLTAIAKATGRFTDLMTKALARHGSRTAWIWIHENCGPKGGHCHLLVHVPADLVSILTNRQRGWLRRITGEPYTVRVIRSDPIGGRLGLEVGNPELHTANLRAALAYLLKGASSQAALRHGLGLLKPGGLIIGKRCGTSQNIGTKARSYMASPQPAQERIR